MKYLVYKITNKINGKIYIGVHKTENIDDGYLGSGKYLKQAIKKYGAGNFEKEILALFDNSEDMFRMESELVNKDFINDKNTYNLRLGGFGGFDYINSIPGLNNTKRNFESIRLGLKLKAETDPVFVETRRKNGSEQLKKLHQECKIKYDTFTGKTHTDETKKKISDMAKTRIGAKNSQFGTCWIYNTDLMENKKIKNEELNFWIDLGWVKGRKICYYKQID